VAERRMLTEGEPDEAPPVDLLVQDWEVAADGSRVERPRREGDVPVLLASSAKAERLLGWTRRWSELDTILATAWAWHKKQT